MKQYDELNQRLKSMNEKFQLPEMERQELLVSINQKIGKRGKKQRTIQWKYYLASTVAILLLFIIVIPFFTNPNQDIAREHESIPTPSGQDKNPIVSESSAEKIKLKVMNYTPYSLKQMTVNVYINEDLKYSLAGSYADGTAIKPGEIMEFEFMEYELNQEKVKLEMEIEWASTGEFYTTNRIPFSISEEQVYYLKLGTESNTSYYLIEDDTNFTIEINNETVEMLRKKVDLNATKSEIENLLGADYRIGKSELDGKETWKYDIGAIEGYQSPTVTYEIEDIKEIKNGAVEAILSFTWNENDELESFTALYVDTEDGNVYSYYLFYNGLEKLDFIY
ncbi:hypothetical protein [Ornithinibacillus halotolerans]|uniref:DUF4179 domain-containing protein n=1 Tax=Ornithinibacillus halotolerans TaxID=1274357 RepID=A0A916S8J6_9BACI|nr:hypothetical protein [Ornithinibacillus halotolerans]GGA88999.1 hypothetical protein GCM10008025_34540 [Ornithinibacillus halotolerans]